MLASISESERVHSSFNLDPDELLKVERSLGMMWNCQLDRFQFTTLQPVSVKTNREMLVAIVKIFDPLGFLLPVTSQSIVSGGMGNDAAEENCPSQTRTAEMGRPATRAHHPQLEKRASGTTICKRPDSATVLS